MPDPVTDPQVRERIEAIQGKLERDLAKVDPHHRLVGRPMTFHVIGGHTLEVTYRDVARIDEAEVLGVKRLIGAPCFCSVMPRTAETLTVRFVVSLRDE